MARGLNILTNAANRAENGPRRIDHRRLPQCKTDGCRRKVLPLKDGGHIDHCDLHRTEDEWNTYYESWCGPQLEPDELLDLLSEGL